MAPFSFWPPKAFKISKTVISDASLAALPNTRDFHEGIEITDAIKASKDVKSSEITVPNGTDSGYASAATTPDRGTSGSISVFTDGVVLPARKLFPPKKTQLKPFGEEIPESIRNRFSDLVELFDKPLYDHLAKSQNNYTSTSIKLKVLGVSEDTAKPWIVIQCHESVSLKVKQFFNQHHIKSQYQPQNGEESSPSFDIVVLNRPPRPMATRVYVSRFGINQSHRSMSCGTLIKIIDSRQTRFATLGGLISVTMPGRTRTIYGMTTGHVIPQITQCEDANEQGGQDDAEDDPSAGMIFEEEEFEIDDDYLHEEEMSEPLHPEQNENNWSEIGGVYAKSRDYKSRSADFDWALMHIDGQALDWLQMNLCHQVPLKEPFSSTNDEDLVVDVEVLTVGVRKTGKLSISSSFLMAGTTRGFTKTYSLMLSGESRKSHT